MGGSLLQYGLSQPTSSEAVLENIDCLRETSYDKQALIPKVTNSEIAAHSAIRFLYCIEPGGGYVFFMDTPGGTGNTFFHILTPSKDRSNRGIALAVAYYVITAILLKVGKTVITDQAVPQYYLGKPLLHNIAKQSYMVCVMQDSKFIVWGESTMACKAELGVLSRKFKD
ncbi:hypothetical protein PR048_027012 [Dryococelus australis]|uniref:ATP-dependent DNA helicase n=1 Tax=Dryococelus australis TaxID=614101 RepID=A0ABQ9GMW4_9NEOP|nr:hypothetical protein PR048_027012 [Dryococelus australis]